jgi:hypothetical protein
MVLDTKKGLLRADKEKGQYVDSEKGNSKENRKKNFFFDIALTLEHRDCLRSSAKSKPAIQFFFFYSFFLLVSDRICISSIEFFSLRTYTATGLWKKQEIKDWPNDDEIRDEYTEKNEDPRLL